LLGLLIPTPQLAAFGGSSGKAFPHNRIAKAVTGYVWLGLVSFSYVWLCGDKVERNGNEFRSKTELPLVPNNQSAITKTGCVWLCSVAFGCVWLFATAPLTKDRCKNGAILPQQIGPRLQKPTYIDLFQGVGFCRLLYACCMPFVGFCRPQPVRIEVHRRPLPDWCRLL
jgi:hypothetical protein